MTTPIVDFVQKYAKSDVSRFHMPGHKGISLLGCEALDITEIQGADVLYSPDGIIAQSENNATKLFGTAHTFYSVEGSSLAIKAMLALIKKRTAKNERTRILAARNAHKAFIYACALLDIDAEWLYPDNFTHSCACTLSAEDIERALSGGDRFDAVYLTSPDYLGNICDVKAISSICHSFGIPFIVDNAHGAYLAFCEPSAHPISLGADMCCDLAHKTLPVLTGGAYLHVSDSYGAEPDEVRSALALFASTSPSYLVLQSLDLCNEYLANGYRAKLGEFIKKLSLFKEQLSAIGFTPEATEPLKIVFSKQTCAYSGDELAKQLRAYAIEPEFYDRDYLVLMATPELDSEAFERIYRALAALPTRHGDTQARHDTTAEKPKALISIREAVFSASETLPVKLAVGRICASPTVSCPPAVPIVMSGEQITERAAELMLHYGIENVEVVK